MKYTRCERLLLVIACEQARSRFLARLASLAQIGELARRLPCKGFFFVFDVVFSSLENYLDSEQPMLE